MDSHKALSKILDGYLQTAVPVEAEPEPNVKAETCLDCDGNAQAVGVSCKSVGCKRKRTKECATE